MEANTLLAPVPTVAANASEHPSGYAWRRLVRWHRDSRELAFVYSRSRGGLIETGRGQIVRLNPESMTIQALGCKLAILLSGATYEEGPQMFFTPDLLRRFNVEGVAIRLANHDWIFFSAESLPSALATDAATIVLPRNDNEA